MLVVQDKHHSIFYCWSPYFFRKSNGYFRDWFLGYLRLFKDICLVFLFLFFFYKQHTWTDQHKIRKQSRRTDIEQIWVQQSFKWWLQNRAHRANAYVEHPSLREEHHSSTVEGRKHIPVGSDVPLAGGGTAFLRPGGGAFFSGSGFLGTTGTSKILFCKFSFMNTETMDTTIL